MNPVDATTWTGLNIPADKLEQESNRGANARRVLEDPLVIEALTSMRERVRGEFFSAALNDTAARERAWLMGQLIERFEDAFKGMVATGDFAAKRISDLEEKRKETFRKRMFG